MDVPAAVPAEVPAAVPAAAPVNPIFANFINILPLPLVVPFTQCITFMMGMLVRTIAFSISQACFITVLLVVWESRFYVELGWQTNLVKALMMLAAIFQCFFVLAVYAFGPFECELMEYLLGFLFKAMVQGGVAIAAMEFMLVSTRTRHNKNDHGTHNLVDWRMMLSTGLLATHSLSLAYLMQPGWDCTVIALYVDLFLAQRATIGGIDKKWFPQLAMVCGVLMIFAKLLNEFLALKRRKKKEEERLLHALTIGEEEEEAVEAV